MELSKQAKKAKAAYQKEWAAKNPGKQHEYLRRYWEKKGAELGNTDVTTTRNNDTDIISVTTCLNCGESFTPKRSDAKYCSDKCRVQHNRKK